MSEYKLLLVDDEEELLDTISTWFSNHGFHVTAAYHPRLALAASAYNKFDAAVVDITLPEMNGLELIDQMKGIGDFPIIVLSGDDNPRLHDAAMERGVYRFLVKPVSMRSLEQIIRESLKDSQASSMQPTSTTLESVS